MVALLFFSHLSLNCNFSRKIFINFVIIYGQLGLGGMAENKPLSQCERGLPEDAEAFSESVCTVLSCCEGSNFFVAQHTAIADSSCAGLSSLLSWPHLCLYLVFCYGCLCLISSQLCVVCFPWSWGDLCPHQLRTVCHTLRRNFLYLQMWWWWLLLYL